MSRTVSQIYGEIINNRNNYLQLTVLDPAVVSASKLSIMNMMMYIVAVSIYTYETLQDLFQIDMLKMMSERRSGTPEYYLRMAKNFQYNSVSESGDEIVFNENNMQMEYATLDTSHRIISKSAYDTVYDINSDYDMTLKVCKESGKNGEESAYIQLDDKELTAFKDYIDNIKFIGTDIECVSLPGDLLTVNTIVYYDDAYVTGKQASQLVKQAIISYINDFDYNDNVYFQKVLDYIQGADHIDYVDADTHIYLQVYDKTNGYGNKEEISNIYKPRSGYIVTVDTGSKSTLTTECCANRPNALGSSANIKLVPKSSL